jgi:hypothetical protein
MSGKAKQWLVAGLARTVVYGPLLAAAAFFLPPAIPVLLMCAAEPWTTNGIQWGVNQLEKRFPAVGGLLNKGLDKWLGASTWKHAYGVEAPIALLVVSHFLAPHLAIAHTLMPVIDFASPVILASALPLATKLADQGFRKLPWLRDTPPAQALVRRRPQAGPAAPDGPAVAGPEGPDAPAPRQAEAPAAQLSGKVVRGRHRAVPPVTRAARERRGHDGRGLG